MVRVKICGITTVGDARQAIEAGADALGLVFAASARRVSQKQALRISGTIGPWISLVGVFVDEDPRTVKQIAEKCRLSAVQLHGNESPEDVKKLWPLRVIKAIRVSDKEDLIAVRRYNPDAYLIDAKVSGAQGGTGRRFPWRLVEGKRFCAPLIVSGGLDPSNVREAVKRLSPYGVDVSSGVERSPGIKDPKKVRSFIRHAKEI